jgi:hypothetical protein
MKADLQAKWEEFLNPASLRSKLISASLFLAAFEILKDSIVERIKDFFTSGFDQNGDIIDPKYKQDVLSRNKSHVYASLEWLKEMGAIDDADIAIFDKLKESRNRIAHEMPNLVTGEIPMDPLLLFTKLVNLLRKIEVWWILNVEIPTNPDYDGKEIDVEGIMPGPLITIRLMTDIALGSEEESRIYFNEFRRNVKA